MGLMPDVVGVFSARVLVADTDATDFSVTHADLRLTCTRGQSKHQHIPV